MPRNTASRDPAWAQRSQETRVQAHRMHMPSPDAVPNPLSGRTGSWPRYRVSGGRAGCSHSLEGGTGWWLTITKWHQKPSGKSWVHQGLPVLVWGGGKARPSHRPPFKGNHFRMTVWILPRENSVASLDNYLPWKDFSKMSLSLQMMLSIGCFCLFPRLFLSWIDLRRPRAALKAGKPSAEARGGARPLRILL